MTDSKMDLNKFCKFCKISVLKINNKYSYWKKVEEKKERY